MYKEFIKKDTYIIIEHVHYKKGYVFIPFGTPSFFGKVHKRNKHTHTTIIHKRILTLLYILEANTSNLGYYFAEIKKQIK